MTPRRIRARDLMTDQELIEVRARSTWKSVALIAHAWILILGVIAIVAVWPNPFTFLLAVAIIGSRQLGLSILMHDGAHGLLANGAKLNMALSQWLCAYPVFAETQAYRRYHLQHHAHTQQDDDPDLILSAPFPITRQSYRRKFWRDISGQTGLAQRKGAVHQCTRRQILADRAASLSFLEQTGPAACRQRASLCRTCCGGCVVGLSAAVAFAALYLDDGYHAYPQHRRTCCRARQRRPVTQHAYHACELD